MNSFTTLAFTALIALSNAQLIQNKDNTFQCTDNPNGVYCAGGSYIIRCSNGIGYPGNCADNLNGYFPQGNAFTDCYQQSPGVGACEKNCVVVGSSGNINGMFTRPDCIPAVPTTTLALTSTPASTETSSSTSTPSFSDCQLDLCLQEFESAPEANRYCDTFLGETSRPGYDIYTPTNPPSFAPMCKEQMPQVQYAALFSACHCAGSPRSVPTSTSSGSIAPPFTIPTSTMTSTASISTSWTTATATSYTHSVDPPYVHTSTSSGSVAPPFTIPTSSPSIAPPFTFLTDYVAAPSATIATSSPPSFSSHSPKSNTTTPSYAHGTIVPTITTTCMTTLTYSSAIYTFPCNSIPTLAPVAPTATRLTTISPSGSGVPNPYHNGTSTFQTSTFLTKAAPPTNTPVGPTGTATGGLPTFTGAAAGRDRGRAGAVGAFATLVAAVLLL